MLATTAQALCIIANTGGYLPYLPVAVQCSQPQCHGAVSIAQTYEVDAHPSSIRIVDQPVVNQLMKDGWQWVSLKDELIFVCLTQPKGK